ncbi:MAG: FliH/SctL family protein [Alphaproteobacteria bacterium]|nr:FliH/SctL family protein [Alphaproteobacteria bacterium]
MSNSKPYKPFTFSTSFDELEKSDLQVADENKRREAEEEKQRLIREEEEANAPPPPPTFSEEELAEAKATAWEEGKQAGLQEALGRIEQETLVALQTLTGHIAVLQDKQSLANESQAAILARIASNIVKKLMPVYSAQHGMEEITTLVHSCLVPLEGKGRININIPAALHDIMKDRLDQVADEAGFEGKIIYIPDENIGPSDVRIDWGRGSAERNIETAIHEVDGIIDQFIANHLNPTLQDAENRLSEAEATRPHQDQRQDENQDMTIENAENPPQYHPEDESSSIPEEHIEAPLPHTGASQQGEVE